VFELPAFVGAASVHIDSAALAKLLAGVPRPIRRKRALPRATAQEKASASIATP
jgi:hypothetical protein